MVRPRKSPPARAKKSDLFEQRVQRIHELLAGFDASVIWNDKVIDPDQPSRRRQIDVTVKRDGLLSLIECRLHRARQNVKWIEELIGRRQSLSAHAVTAVSASGFTKGAVAKASRYGVFLRDLRELSDDDVRQWGRSVALTLYFFEYSNIVLKLTFPTETVAQIDGHQLETDLLRHPILKSVFNAAADIVGQRLIPAVKDKNLVAKFGFQLGSPPIVLCGLPVLAFEVKGRARMVCRTLSAAAQSYGAPSEDAGSRDTIIEKYSLGETSVVHHGIRISTHIDLAALELRPLHQFRYFEVDSGSELVDHERLSISGIDALQVQRGIIAIEVFGAE